MRILFSLLIFFIISLNVKAQTEWFPEDLNIQPFTAHFLEPKAGFQYLFDIKKVRIDIGTSHDFVHWKNDNKTFSIGADFFTYTRARSESNFKFPVETIDYLFGLNTGYKSSSKENEFGFRLRLSHISAHLADGYYDYAKNYWLNNRKPFGYSREFFELIGYYKIYNVRIYGGVTYNIHVYPDDIKNESFQIGFDYYPEQLKTSVFIPFIAYDIRLTGTEKYSGSSIITGGLKFGEIASRGFSILITYFSGSSVHGEFYNLKEHYTTIGINLDI